MKKTAIRMRTLTLASALVLSLSGGILAANSMPGMSMPATPDPAPLVAVAAPASGTPDLSGLGLTPDQQSALNPLIAQALKVEATKKDELAKLTAERAQVAAQAKPDAKKLSSLDKLIQIKQGEITVSRGQAQIAFAKVVGDAQAKAVADRVFGVKPAVATTQNHDQWLDQMSSYMDQMMKQIPDLTQKNPDEALKLMTEMTKVMGQMTMMKQDQRRGMMVPMAQTAPAPAPGNTDPNAGMSGGGMGMDMMQGGMQMMQQMMQMMPMMGNDKNEMNMGGSSDPNASSGGMNMSDPNSNSGSGMMDMDKMGMGGMMRM